MRERDGGWKKGVGERIEVELTKERGREGIKYKGSPPYQQPGVLVLSVNHTSFNFLPQRPGSSGKEAFMTPHSPGIVLAPVSIMSWRRWRRRRRWWWWWWWWWRRRRRRRGRGEAKQGFRGRDMHMYSTCRAHVQHMQGTCTGHAVHSPPQSELSSDSTKPQSEGEREEGRRLDTVDKDKVLAAATVLQHITRGRPEQSAGKSVCEAAHHSGRTAHHLVYFGPAHIS